jgi:hypothetical protein
MPDILEALGAGTILAGLVLFVIVWWELRK